MEEKETPIDRTVSPFTDENVVDLELFGCENMDVLYWGNLDVTKDCAASAIFFNGAVSQNLDSLYQTSNISFLTDTVNFIVRSAKDNSWNETGTCTELWVYFWSLLMSEVDPLGFEIAMKATAKECKEEFCKRVEWPGNADIVGKGMVAAFAIEAIVVTFFALAAVLAAVQTALHAWKHRKSPSPSRAASPEQLEKGQVDLKKEEAIAATVDSMSTKRLNGHRRRSSNAFEKIPKDSKGKRPWGNRFRSAFRGTISGFWEGAVMFSISLSIAAAVVFFSKSGSYSLFFSALITVFASSCCYALWPLVDGITGRRTLYNIMLLFITIQQFMLFGAFRRYVDMDNYHETIATPEEDHIRGELWEQYCFYKIKPTVFIERIVSVTLGFGCIVLLKMFFVDFLRPVLRKRNNVLGDKDRKPHTFMLWDWTEKYKWWLDLSWKVFVGGCGFSMMWGSYGRMIIGKKRLLALHAGAGNLEGENSWEFGQITAVLTWVPYSGEFIFILCLGYRRAITSRIPKDLRAIFVTPASDPSKDVGSGSADEEPSPLNKRSTTMILNPFSIGLDRLGGRRKSKKQETAEVPSQSTYDPDGIEETAATTTTVEYEDLKGGKGTGGHYEHRSL